MDVRGLLRAVAVVAACAGPGGVGYADPGEALTLAIAKAEAGMDPVYTSQPEVIVRLTDPCRQAFARLTTANVGKHLSIAIDGTEMSRVRVLNPIHGDVVLIFVPGDAEARARKLADGRSTAVVTVLPLTSWSASCNGLARRDSNA